MLKPVQLEPFNSPVGPATPVTQEEPSISKLLLQLGDWLSFHTIVTMGFKMAYVCSGERGRDRKRHCVSHAIGSPGYS